MLVNSQLLNYQNMKARLKEAKTVKELETFSDTTTNKMKHKQCTDLPCFLNWPPEAPGAANKSTPKENKRAPQIYSSATSKEYNEAQVGGRENKRSVV